MKEIDWSKLMFVGFGVATIVLESWPIAACTIALILADAFISGCRNIDLFENQYQEIKRMTECSLDQKQTEIDQLAETLNSHTDQITKILRKSGI